MDALKIILIILEIFDFLKKNIYDSLKYSLIFYK